MENIPPEIISVILSFFEDVPKIEHITNVALISRTFLEIAIPILERRYLIQWFARMALPDIIYNRALCDTKETRIINMSDLLNLHIDNSYEARIIYNKQLARRSPVMAMAIIIDSLSNPRAKKIWLEFFTMLGPREENAARALLLLPRAPRAFSLISV